MRQRPGKSRKAVLLILPCSAVKPYVESPTWRYVIHHIDKWRKNIDLVAIDCITDPRTGRPFGIVGEWEQHLTLNLDEKPNNAKYPLLQPVVKEKLSDLVPYYNSVISYLNVKLYWKTIESVRDDFQITMLPKKFRGRRSWDSKRLKMTPRNIFYHQISELTGALDLLPIS
jgi:hypothetical protein